MMKVFLGFVILFALSADVRAADMFIDFTKNDNIQTKLIKQFPTGIFVADNSFATPFDITADANGNNFSAISSDLTINTSVYGVRDIFTLMNAVKPPPGEEMATVEFIGSAGADETFELTDGTNIRDYYNGSFANNINGTTTQNAFTVKDVRGSAGTGDVNTGDIGTYRIDEQDFHLVPAFLSQTLKEIILANVNSSGNPILLGVTASPPILGDCNDDGKVDSADLTILLANFGRFVTGGYDDGDFNLDDVVNADDLALYQLGVAEYNISIGQPAPEPGGVGLAAIASLGLLRQRRRSASK